VRFVFLALPMALAIGVVVFLLEYFIPWQEDIDCWVSSLQQESVLYVFSVFLTKNRNAFATPGANIFAMKSWPPGIAGMGE
jgi:hypothetical protein